MRQPLSLLLAVLLPLGGFPFPSWAGFISYQVVEAPEHRAETFEDWVIFIDPDNKTYFARRADYDAAVLEVKTGGEKNIRPDVEIYTTFKRIPVYVFKASMDPMEKEAEVPLPIEAGRKIDFSTKDIEVRVFHYHKQAARGRVMMTMAGGMPPSPGHALEIWDKGAKEHRDIPVRICTPKTDMTCGDLIKVSRNGYKRRVQVTSEGKPLYSKNAPLPKKPDSSVVPPSLLKAIGEKFPESAEIERLVAAQIVLLDKKGQLPAITALPESRRQAAFAALIGDDLHGKAVGMIKAHLSGEGTAPPVKAVLDSGKKDNDFLSAYCSQILRAQPAGDRAKPIFQSLRRLAQEAKLGAGAPASEAARAALGQIYTGGTGDQLVGRCGKFYKGVKLALYRKQAAAEQLRASNLLNNGDAPPAGFPAASDTNAGGKKSAGLKGLLEKPGVKEGLFAAMAGGMGLGLMGFLLGGPIGGLVMGAIGAAALGGISYAGAKK